MHVGVTYHEKIMVNAKAGGMNKAQPVPEEMVRVKKLWSC